MNYQILPLFVTKITTLLFLFIALLLSFFGVSALLCYFILIGIAFPVVISMRLHRLQASGVALTLAEDSQWIIYIYGFPAQEQRSVLKNTCFSSHARLRQFFILGFSGRLCLQIACIAILIQEYINGGNVIATLFALTFLVTLAGKGVHSVYRVIGNHWQCESLTTSTGTIWYQGFISKGQTKEPLLDELV